MAEDIEKDDSQHAEQGHWLDELGAGAMAAMGAGVFLMSIVVMVMINQIGSAITSNAVTPMVDDIAFAVPQDMVAVLPALPAGRSHDADTPAWLAHSEPFEASARTPLIAVVILDDGTQSSVALRGLDDDEPLSFAVAADFGDSSYRIEQIRRAGREALALLPFGYGADFGRDPNVLRRGLTEAELTRRLHWHLARAGEGIVGAVDQHGDDIVRDETALRVIGDGLVSSGMLMIDSRSDADSLISARLRPMGVPVGRRTVRVGRDDDADTAFAALTDAERHAFAWGTAIVLVEAGDTAMNTVQKWLETRSESIALAPVSHVVRRMRTGMQDASN